MKEHKESPLRYLTFQSFEQFEWMTHLFTTRHGGCSSNEFSTLNLSFTRGDNPECVLENYSRVASALGGSITEIVCSDQTHTDHIRIVTKDDCGKGVIRQRDYTDIDGLITNKPGVTLACFFADCVPVYLVDPVHRVVGLCHSGWRGTKLKISAKMLQKMNELYGTNPTEVYAGIGPCICGNCYEIGNDVAKEFMEFSFADEILQKTDEEHYHLDLVKTNEKILLQVGVLKEKIELPGICTCCNPEFLFSHRASHGKRGNLGAFIRIKP